MTTTTTTAHSLDAMFDRDIRDLGRYQHLDEHSCKRPRMNQVITGMLRRERGRLLGDQSADRGGIGTITGDIKRLSGYRVLNAFGYPSSDVSVVLIRMLARERDLIAGGGDTDPQEMRAAIHRDLESLGWEPPVAGRPVGKNRRPKLLDEWQGPNCRTADMLIRMLLRETNRLPTEAAAPAA